MAKTNEKALAAFIEKMGEVNNRIETLKHFCNDHMEFDPEGINWSHVGTAGHVLEQLTEITEFLGLNYGAGNFTAEDKEKFFAWLRDNLSGERLTVLGWEYSWREAVEKDACGQSYELSAGDSKDKSPHLYRLS